MPAITSTLHFSERELRCRRTGLINFHPGFLELLEKTRVIYDSPMILTSACRSAEHNRIVGGHPNSLHIGDILPHAARGQQGAMAVDIHWNGGTARGHLFHVLWSQGFSIGWGRGFLHADMRIWIGMEQYSFDY